VILDLFDTHSPISAGNEAIMVEREENFSINIAIAPEWYSLADHVYGLFA
jgi:hypothetical protein